MPFNKKISGFQNEKDFADYLNETKVSELNPMFYDFLKVLYKNIDDNSVIHSWIDYDKKKTDIYIKINGIKKAISIKKGIKNSVRVEEISAFIEFLRRNNIEKTILKEILKYHYADGTENGSGVKRLSAKEYKIKNQEKIDLINKNLNNKNLIRKAINRFVLKGNVGIDPIDMIIYGVVDDFIWATTDEIIEIILNKIDDYSSSIHFSCLSFQPLARCLNKNKKYENKRHSVQIKWYNISDHFIEVMATIRNKNNVF